MRENTKITTVQITQIEKGTEKATDISAAQIKEVFDADDVVITRQQDFIRDEENTQ